MSELIHHSVAKLSMIFAWAKWFEICSLYETFLMWLFEIDNVK